VEQCTLLRLLLKVLRQKEFQILQDDDDDDDDELQVLSLLAISILKYQDLFLIFLNHMFLSTDNAKIVWSSF
jgi:hypothetical protein